MKYPRILDSSVLVYISRPSASYRPCTFVDIHSAEKFRRVVSLSVNMLSLATLATFAVLLVAASGGALDEPTGASRFLYEYKVMERLVNLEQENTDLRDRVRQLEVNKSARVAVKVRLLANQDVTSNSRVRYNVEMWNIGDAYDLDNAEFVTPFSGIYSIVTQVCLGYADAPWIDLDVIKDGATIGRVFSGNKVYHSCGSEATSIHLNKGDKIWVNKVAGTGTILNEDHGWNTFTAVLVLAD